MTSIKTAKKYLDKHLEHILRILYNIRDLKLDTNYTHLLYTVEEIILRMLAQEGEEFLRSMVNTCALIEHLLNYKSRDETLAAPPHINTLRLELLGAIDLFENRLRQIVDIDLEKAIRENGYPSKDLKDRVNKIKALPLKPETVKQ